MKRVYLALVTTLVVSRSYAAPGLRYGWMIKLSPDGDPMWDVVVGADL